MSFRFQKREVLICFLAVFGMGFFLSFLILCDLGTDPCTFMNRSTAARVGLSFGTWQLIVNAVMLAIVFFCKRSLIGFGTLFNMVLVGYYADFFDWLWGKCIPDKAFTMPVSRWSIFLVALFCFIVSAAVYINADMGVAPYDGLPIIITGKVVGRWPKVPPMVVRIAWDAAAIVVGVLVGGVPIVGIILMALFLGPAITLVRKLGERLRKAPAGDGARAAEE
ncbi:MAG: hypothetical protein J5645_04580 [Lachnospiraceae bacterium]|nr:hypothetical protein [Lachnospiraceae bacterium]